MYMYISYKASLCYVHVIYSPLKQLALFMLQNDKITLSSHFEIESCVLLTMCDNMQQPLSGECGRKSIKKHSVPLNGFKN